ncbi:MAG TPA: hypothetical protein VJJ22_03810 [Candidatus Paceibacterota bacterium]
MWQIVPPPDYWHEEWYPLFLVAFVTELLVVWATLIIDSHSARARSIWVLFPAGLGSLMMMHPIGWGLYISLIMCGVIAPGIPPPAALMLFVLGGLAVIGFWWAMVGETVHRVLQRQKEVN